jgi:hypothetical protein
MLKKFAALTLIVGAFLMLSGCSSNAEPTPKSEPAPIPKREPQRYTAYGRYYTDGTVITEDGNERSYTTDSISDRTPTDAMPVWIGFDDNGTAEVTDDIILGLVYDRNTAIYDELETALSEKFEIERDGNNIHIGGIK